MWLNPGVYPRPGTEQTTHSVQSQQANTGAPGFLHRRKLENMHGELKLLPQYYLTAIHMNIIDGGQLLCDFLLSRLQQFLLGWRPVKTH